MDGDMARLDDICDLAEKYGAMVMIDDSHATGFVGESGRGAHEFFHVMERVDIITSTFGKALGGASGGFASGRKEIIELLRQRSRPYLFSNTLAPMIVAGSIKAIELIRESDKPRQRLISNTKRFRNGISELGFQIKEGDHPIVPIMLGEADKAKQMARDLYERGVYLVGFSYPVVPMGQARVRVQLSAAHSDQDLDYALEQFRQIAR
jgi:glycine C-acetyltransferase